MDGTITGGAALLILGVEIPAHPAAIARTGTSISRTPPVHFRFFAYLAFMDIPPRNDSPEGAGKEVSVKTLQVKTSFRLLVPGPKEGRVCIVPRYRTLTVGKLLRIRVAGWPIGPSGSSGTLLSRAGRLGPRVKGRAGRLARPRVRIQCVVTR